MLFKSFWRELLEDILVLQEKHASTSKISLISKVYIMVEEHSLVNFPKWLMLILDINMLQACSEHIICHYLVLF